jgi:NAD(P)H-dependent flavin oxidoreductase YrpB (nitropropane dioxygenase family)
MTLAPRYTELTGCRVPVQQAPMGSVSTAALAVAVAEAGGVGSITALGLTAAQLGQILAGMTARTTAATGHIDATPMYAGESAAVISAVEPAARIIESWAAAVPR